MLVLDIIQLFCFTALGFHKFFYIAGKSVGHIGVVDYNLFDLLDLTYLFDIFDGSDRFDLFTFFKSALETKRATRQTKKGAGSPLGRGADLQKPNDTQIMKLFLRQKAIQRQNRNDSSRHQVF